MIYRPLNNSDGADLNASACSACTHLTGLDRMRRSAFIDIFSVARKGLLCGGWRMETPCLSSYRPGHVTGGAGGGQVTLTGWHRPQAR